MKILFLSIIDFEDLSERNIYTDLLREFLKDGHYIYAISPVERRQNKESSIKETSKFTILKPVIGNIQKTDFLEKGISILTLESILIKSIKKNFNNVRFDLILYATPPITFQKVVQYIHKRDNAKIYLMLKDIWPQSLVDLEIISYNNPLYKYFRKKEKKLYQEADIIGCMSQGNIEYILKENKELVKNKVVLCPNAIEPDTEVKNSNKKLLCDKYQIPAEKMLFIYGGNLGIPQGIDFIINCMEEVKERKDVFFLLVGNGTEYFKLETALLNKNMCNVKLMPAIVKEDFEHLVSVCDVGLIFLDKRFTIPNFPSRILSYMNASLPVYALTDKNTDICKTIREGLFGWWSESSETKDFKNTLDHIISLYYNNKDKFETYGVNARKYMEDNYTAEKVYKMLMNDLV